jgi:hypothetical protein
MNYANVSGGSKQAYEPDLQTLQTKKPFQHKLERLLHPERPTRNHFHAGIHQSIYCFTPSA